MLKGKGLPLPAPWSIIVIISKKKEVITCRRGRTRIDFVLRLHSSSWLAHKNRQVHKYILDGCHVDDILHHMATGITYDMDELGRMSLTRPEEMLNI